MEPFDQEIMARTGMGEARGEGQTAMIGVMWTGMNRFTAKRWFSAMTIAGCFLRKLQYDCWMPDDPNFVYISNITPTLSLFSDALMWAANIIKGQIPDPTQGATHYHDTSISPPSWTEGATQTVQLGRLIFYKDVA